VSLMVRVVRMVGDRWSRRTGSPHKIVAAIHGIRRKSVSLWFILPYCQYFTRKGVE
jgi:hypothetical protein